MTTELQQSELRMIAGRTLLVFGFVAMLGVATASNSFAQSFDETRGDAPIGVPAEQPAMDAADVPAAAPPPASSTPAEQITGADVAQPPPAPAVSQPADDAPSMSSGNGSNAPEALPSAGQTLPENVNSAGAGGADQAVTPPPAADAAPAMPEAQAVGAAAVAASTPRDDLPHNLSPWGMFLAADMVVKFVMILLAVASVMVWTAWFAKLAQVTFARRRVRRRTEELEQQATINASDALASKSRDPVSAMVRAAMRELDLSENGSLPRDGINERITSRLARIEAAAGRAMNSGTGLLATVGGTAPFIGLFGTVWGIMNSFIGISKAHTTNLAVVAPGIAEALLATAIGLVAAIPAVIFYNQLARSISGYKAALADASAVIERHVSRDLDRHRAGRGYQLKAAE